MDALPQNPDNSSLAKMIAVFFHPLLMPTYATWLIFNTGSYLSFSTSAILQRFIYLVVFVSTAVFPSIAAFSLVKQGKIQSLEMPVRKERIFPIIITMICYSLAVFFLLRLSIPRIFGYMVGGGLVAVTFSFIINLRWKISLHMTGIGGLMGLMFAYARLFHVNMILPLIIIAVSAGMLGWSRLRSNSHSPSQIYAGFISGFLIEFCYMWFFIREILWGAF